MPFFVNVHFLRKSIYIYIYIYCTKKYCDIVSSFQSYSYTCPIQTGLMLVELVQVFLGREIYDIKKRTPIKASFFDY